MSHVLNESFFRKKPVIGVIHLMPLPGSPRYSGGFEDVFERAFNDAKSYVEGGVDAVIVENFGDKPFAIRVREAETLAGELSLLAALAAGHLAEAHKKLGRGLIWKSKR